MFFSLKKNLRKDLIFNLIFFLDKMFIRFSIINSSFYKNFFIYTSLNWLVPSTILLRFNSIFYNTMMIELFGVDCKSNKFCVNSITYIYIYYNLTFREKFFFSYSGFYNTSISSISSFFPNAQWPERELSEMFGILFYNKNDNRRLLLDYLFNGYPLLKSYPVSGWTEIIYSYNTSWLSLVFIQSIEYVTYDTYYSF